MIDSWSKKGLTLQRKFSLKWLALGLCLSTIVSLWDFIRFLASGYASSLSGNERVGSVAEKVKAPFLRRPCDHDRVIYVQFPPSSDTLLRPWIRPFTMIISAWWLWTSSKFSGKKSKKQQEKLGNGQLLSGCGFVQNIASPSLSRDRKIKMEQTNKHLPNPE